MVKFHSWKLCKYSGLSVFSVLFLHDFSGFTSHMSHRASEVVSFRLPGYFYSFHQFHVGIYILVLSVYMPHAAKTMLVIPQVPQQHIVWVLVPQRVGFAWALEILRRLSLRSVLLLLWKLTRQLAQEGLLLSKLLTFSVFV